MNESIITARGLGKMYVLGRGDPASLNFREAVRAAVAAPFRRLRELRGGGAPEQKFWALENVSFDIGRGEIVGLIGRNGAGKSTLLKVLSRITEPTTGRADLRGRVGALLEVGTGFHPELTGRENIFLNGAILGMSHREIIKQFERIVAFADIDGFLDTPVKRYSSGMYVRLAFAVAAHLEPEILIVDEVLAVGDAEFQRKCLGRMDELRSHSGRTIFLVSHNLEMVESLCTRCILLDKGRVVFDGKTGEALIKYRELGGRGGEITITETNRLQWDGLRNRKSLESVSGDSDLTFELAFRTGDKSLEGVFLDLELVDAAGRRATHSKTRFLRRGFALPTSAHIAFRYTLRAPMLAPGQYYLILYAYDAEGVLAWVEHIDACSVSAKSYFPAVDFIDEIKGTTVPHFEIELL
jgi:ABC-type polysaccharide/polyol phosphate transport system ATPase subunit